MQSRSTTLWTFAITSVALFMVTLDNLVVTSALPVIRRNLHASLTHLEWTVNAYTLTFAVLLLTGAARGGGSVGGRVAGASVGGRSPGFVGARVGVGVVVVLFGLWALRGAAPVLPVGLFRTRAFALASVSWVFMFFGMFGSTCLLIQF